MIGLPCEVTGLLPLLLWPEPLAVGMKPQFEELRVNVYSWAIDVTGK